MLVGASLSWSYIEADAQRLVVFRAPFWKFAIRWDEIKKIEIGNNGIAFSGGDKTLIMTLQMMDARSASLWQLIQAQSSKRNIEFKQVATVRWTQKNTRVDTWE